MDKTGNEFGTKEFVKKPGKYYQVNIDNHILSRQLTLNLVPTKLSEPLYGLMQLLFDENVMKSTLLAYCVDLDNLPLGLVSRQTILNAIDILAKMSSLLSTNSPNQNQNQIVAASNQFYSYYPQDVGVQRITAIPAKLDKYDLMTGELNRERDLFDVCHEQLEDSAEIKMLNKSSGMYAQILKYVENTQMDRKCTVEEIFEVIRHEDVLRYEPYEKNFNRQLLFHGSSIVNFVGILTNGLKIAPPEAHFHGSIFGKGIYFSDSLSKAASYCHATKGTGLVLLCEVAAGISDIRHRSNRSELISYCESVQAIGQYYPHPLHVRPDGLKIPNGELIKRPEQTGILFNEFVLFDESRVKISYLVKLKF